MSYLKIENLNKTYGQTRIIKGLSLTVPRGEFVSLLGPSGSGKTTILRCIAGLERPDADSGAIELDASTLSRGGEFVEPEMRGMGMVFQNYAVWPHMNVFENVAFPLRIARRNRLAAAQLKVKVEEVLSLVKLDPYARRFAHELSGGQQQRVALARALVVTPRLLLLDEPLSNLDALLREDLGSEIRRLQKRLGLTTILVTHDQKEALSLSDRIVVLNGGRIEADGTPEGLYSEPPSDFVAEFLAGGQRVRLPNGAERLFLPRRWRVEESSAAEGFACRVAARIYRGSDYEYLAETTDLPEPIRFFSAHRHEMGDVLTLRYGQG